MVAPAESIEAFQEDLRRSSMASRPSIFGKPWDIVDSSERRKSATGVEASETNTSDPEGTEHNWKNSIDSEKLLLNTLIQLKQINEDNLATTRSTLGILENAISALQMNRHTRIQEETPPAIPEEESNWSSCCTSTRWPWNFLYWKLKGSALMSLLAGSNLLIG